MNENRIVTYLESSFLAPLLEEEVTDISFNGEAIFLEENVHGRKKAALMTSKEEVGDFLRQIANLSEKQFSYSSPTLDVSFGRYRLNATFLNITRVKDEKSYSFCLRILKEGSAITDDPSFMEKKAKEILFKALEENESIVIGGIASSGKSELQKYLLLHLPERTRVIVIDNLKELERIRGQEGIDLTSWQVDEKSKDASYAALIRNALRFNPDYIVVAESRGGEVLEAITSAMSGHPIITTLHTRSVEAMPNRMARLAMLGERKVEYEEVMEDIYDHFSYFVYLEKKVGKSGKIQRRLSKIGKLNRKNKTMEIVYERGER